MPPAQQLDLLDWTPPPATVRFDDAAVRAATIHARISRAIGVALKDAGADRAEIARRMAAFLGEAVPVNMLNAYASQAREDHVISVPRYLALMAATGDRRLLQLLAEDMGWAVVEKRHLPMIELAEVQEKLAELEAHRAALKRRVKAGGR